MPFLEAEAAIRRFQAQHNLPIRGAEVLDDADMAELTDEDRLKRLREVFAGLATRTDEELEKAAEDAETAELIRTELLTRIDNATKALKDNGAQDSIAGKGLIELLEFSKHHDIEERRRFQDMKQELETKMYAALDGVFNPSIEAGHTRMHEIMLAAIPGLGPVLDDMLEDIKSNEDQLLARVSERVQNMRAEVRAEMSEMSEIVKNMAAEMQVELRQTGAGDSQRLATLENRVALLVHREGRNGRRLENINEAIDRKLDRFERKLDSIERRLDSLERKA